MIEDIEGWIRNRLFFHGHPPFFCERMLGKPTVDACKHRRPTRERRFPSAVLVESRSLLMNRLSPSAILTGIRHERPGSDIRNKGDATFRLDITVLL